MCHIHIINSFSCLVPVLSRYFLLSVFLQIFFIHCAFSPQSSLFISVGKDIAVSCRLVINSFFLYCIYTQTFEYKFHSLVITRVENCILIKALRNINKLAINTPESVHFIINKSGIQFPYNYC